MCDFELVKHQSSLLAHSNLSFREIYSDFIRVSWASLIIFISRYLHFIPIFVGKIQNVPYNAPVTGYGPPPAELAFLALPSKIIEYQTDVVQSIPCYVIGFVQRVMATSRKMLVVWNRCIYRPHRLFTHSILTTIIFWRMLLWVTQLL